MNTEHHTTLAAIVRAYPEQPPRKPRKSDPTRAPFAPYDRLVVIDTETTTDDTLTMPGFEGESWDGLRQRLLFGRALVLRHTGNRAYAPEREIVFYPDDLPGEGVERLRAALEAEPNTELMTQRDFLADLYKTAVKTTRQTERVAIVGFNLAFDLSRIALSAEPSRRNSDQFTFRFWEYTDKQTGRQKRNAYRPNLTIKDAGDFKFYRWTNTRQMNSDTGQRYTIRYQNNFIDCQTLMKALFNECPSLDGALAYMAKKTGEPLEQKDETDQHGVITSDYVAYNRRDVQLTAKLAVWLLKEAAQHPVSDPAKLYSTASLSKAYMAAMGIDGPPALRLDGLRETPDQLTGYLMSTYYGARTEVALRCAKVPVVYLDFLSMYPTVIIIGGLWDMMRAESITAREDTSAVQQFIDRVTLDDLFNPATWRDLNAIVLLQPDNDILPVRADYGGGSVNIGFPYTTSDIALWYSLHDVIASKILTGKAPRIMRAIRITADSPREGMQPVTLFGAARIDPYHDNLFKVAIEERKQVKDGVGRYADTAKPVRDAIQQTLKILANSTYGYFIEMNDKTIDAQEYNLYSVDESTTVKDWIEVPGRYFSPAISTFVTAGARLMLALLERLVTDAGGQHVFCDTDSMAIVSLPERQTVALTSTGAGGARDATLTDIFLGNDIVSDDDGRVDTPITALSWTEVDRIIQRFEALNPYDPTKVPDTVLKVEDVNFEGDNPRNPRRQLYAYAVSSKRHCLFTEDGQPVKVTLSALGGVINPDPDKYERRKETSESFVEQRARDLWTVFLRDGRIDHVPHIDAPMVRQRTISTPNTAQYFKHLNTGKPYAAQVKPFSFYLEASCLIGPYGGQAQQRTVIRAFEKNPGEWLTGQWIQRDNGEPVYLLVMPDFGPGNKPSDVYMEAVYLLSSAVETWARAITFRNFFNLYMRHPEVKFCGVDGQPCNQQTTGLLQRRRVHIAGLMLTGKEGKAIRRNDDRQRPILADFSDEVISLNRGDAGPLNNPPVTGAQLHAMFRAVLLDMPRARLVQAVRLNRRNIARHLQADQFPRQYRELYHNAAIDYAEHQTGEKSLAALWRYVEWRGVWDIVRPALDVDADMRVLFPGKRDKDIQRKWDRTRAILTGRRAPSVQEIIALLGKLEPVYQARVLARTPAHPGLKSWPVVPVARFLDGLAFWHAVAGALYWQSKDGRARVQAHRRMLPMLSELGEGVELVETLTPDGWQWRERVSDFESALSIARAKTDFFYRLRTMGRGPLDQRHIEDARREARAILKRDYDLSEGTTLESGERALLAKLASDNDDIVRRAIDSVRDQRLRGRVTPRRKDGKERAPYRADRFISAADEDATNRLRESRNRRRR